MKSFGALILFIAAAYAAAAVGAQFPPDAWYASLAKPTWNPPNWVFAPVWTALYLLIGISGWLLWQTAGFSGAPVALTFYVVQLVLNAAWSWLFFGLHLPGAAFAEILLLWAAILVTTALFWSIRPVAGLLLLPYLAWVMFATVLNGTIWYLN